MFVLIIMRMTLNAPVMPDKIHEVNWCCEKMSPVDRSGHITTRQAGCFPSGTLMAVMDQSQHRKWQRRCGSLRRSEPLLREGHSITAVSFCMDGRIPLLSSRWGFFKQVSAHQPSAWQRSGCRRPVPDIFCFSFPCELFANFPFMWPKKGASIAEGKGDSLLLLLGAK